MSEELIDQKIKNNKVSDDASRNLRKVRKQLQIIEKEIQSKMLKFLRHPKQRNDPRSNNRSKRLKCIRFLSKPAIK